MTERSKEQKESSRSKKGPTARDRQTERSNKLRAMGTMQSVESQGGKSQSVRSQVPQNFNSFRHVITNSTTGDDVQWIVHLRELKVQPGKIPPTIQQTFSFGDTQTVTSSIHKNNCDYEIKENSAYVDHLLRKKKCRETPNWSQGFFETGLRTYMSDSNKKRLSELEKGFSTIPYKTKKTKFPEFLVDYKTEKKVREQLRSQEKVVKEAKDSMERSIQIRKLPKLHYTAFDSRNNNLEYNKLEEMNQSKKNMNQTRHLELHEGYLPTVAWEASLRDKPLKKKVKLNKDADEDTKAK